MKAKELKLRSRFCRGDKDQKENHGSLALQQEKRRKKRRQRQTGKLIRKCMKRVSKKGRIKILRARMNMRKKTRRPP